MLPNIQGLRYEKSIAIIASLALIVTACAVAPQPDEGNASSGLTFVHLNDTYRIGVVEDGNAGGLGRVVTVIRGLQAAGRDVRILHGGDFLYPPLESQLWNGLQMVDAFNLMAAHAPMHVIIGNHEIDRRAPEHLIAAVYVPIDSNYLGIAEEMIRQFESNDVDEIDANKEYSLVVPDFLYGGGDGYQIPKDRFASRPGSELKYLVLDAIITAQAPRRRIGGQWMRPIPVTSSWARPAHSASRRQKRAAEAALKY